MARSGETQTISSVRRAADVLTLFAETDSPTLGVTEIAQALDLSKAVVHRILASYREKGFVTIDESTRRYSLGPAALSLGMAYLEQVDVRRLARPEMEELSARTNETATLSIRSGQRHRVYLDQVTPPREVRMSVELGRPFPLHAGSSSKAFLAFLPEEEREEYLTKETLRPLTELTITDPDALRQELERIRARGYATSLGERQPGAASVAAPILDYEARPVAVISVCGPVERFRDEAEEAAQFLVERTGAISEWMGHRPRAAG